MRMTFARQKYLGFYVEQLLRLKNFRCIILLCKLTDVKTQNIQYGYQLNITSL